MVMKNVYEVLRQKEMELTRLEKEVEALRLVAPLLSEEKEMASDMGKPALAPPSTDPKPPRAFQFQRRPRFPHRNRCAQLGGKTRPSAGRNRVSRIVAVRTPQRREALICTARDESRAFVYASEIGERTLNREAEKHQEENMRKAFLAAAVLVLSLTAAAKDKEMQGTIVSENSVPADRRPRVRSSRRPDVPGICDSHRHDRVSRAAGKRRRTKRCCR